MTILLTGGAGYIGSHTLKLLKEQGHKVTVLDWNPDGYEKIKHLITREDYIEGNILNPSDLDRAFSTQAFEAVMHFAAFIEAGESVTEPAKYLWNNTAGTISLLNAMLKHKVYRLIFSSTAAVYGEPTQIPITETAKKEPTNPYGTSKLLAEQAITEAANYSPLQATILRYFNASGSGPDGTLSEKRTHETHLIPLVLQVAAGKRKNIKIFGTDYPTPDGTAIRDYIHVSDLAAAHSAALKQKDKLAIYNVGTGEGYSVKEVVEACRQETQQPILAQEEPRRPGDPAELVADATKIKRELGWQPRYSDLPTIIQTSWTAVKK